MEAVSVGAVLSDYQRVRVENVCARLGLTSLGYLWCYDQMDLLKEMISCHMEAVMVKVACMGKSTYMGKGTCMGKATCMGNSTCMGKGTCMGKVTCMSEKARHPKSSTGALGNVLVHAC